MDEIVNLSLSTKNGFNSQALLELPGFFWWKVNYCGSKNKWTKWLIQIILQSTFGTWDHLGKSTITPKFEDPGFNHFCKHKDSL